ncbi:hypothetical protein [Halomontanus rarus]
MTADRTPPTLAAADSGRAGILHTDSDSGRRQSVPRTRLAFVRAT